MIKLNSTLNLIIIQNMNDTQKWIISNCIVGTCIYPLDTLKTLSQLNVKTNPKTLYKGFSQFIIQRAIGKGFSFYVFTHLCPLTKNWQWKDMFNACFATAVVSSLYSTPLEYYKIHKQLLKNHKGNPFCLKSLRLTFLRDFIALSAYFPVFASLNTEYGAFGAGGIAGVTAAIASYPFDNYKTLIQTSTSLVPRNFYTGIQYSIVKSFLSHGMTFYLYKKFLS